MVLLDGAEHSYWEVDEPRLRADLAQRELTVCTANLVAQLVNDPWRNLVPLVNGYLDDVVMRP